MLTDYYTAECKKKNSSKKYLFTTISCLFLKKVPPFFSCSFYSAEEWQRYPGASNMFVYTLRGSLRADFADSRNKFRPICQKGRSDLSSSIVSH